MGKMKDSSTPQPPPPSPSPRGVVEMSTGKPNQVGTVVLYGIPIVSLVIESQERLCLAQISNTLLKGFSYNEIHNRRVALGITCVQCTPVQLEILRRAGAMPVSSRRCGMITRREAERLCKSFLGDNAPPRLPDDFAFSVHHECAWGCRGSFLPSRYNSSRAKCIKCTMCALFFSPNKFIFHSHRLSAADKYVQPDAANFNSWRRHMKLSGAPPQEVVYAWEDVKAMFNGGTRKRMLANSIAMPSSSSSAAAAAAASSSRPAKTPKVVMDGQPSHHQPPPIVPAPRLPCHQEALPLPISRVAMDFIYNKPFALAAASSYSSFPWLKRNPLLFPHEHPFFPIEKSYQSAFRPVQQPTTSVTAEEEPASDDEVDIETTDDKSSEPLMVAGEAQWSPKSEAKMIEAPESPGEELPSAAILPPGSSTTQQQQQQQQELLPASALTHRIWNLSRLSFDGTDRTNFLYRQDLHRHFVLAADAASQSPVALTSKSVDCSTCIAHDSPAFGATTENNNKLTPQL